MTFEQFKYYLDAYGASLHRWPAEARAAAEAFLASSPAAGAAQAEVRRLDLLLDQYGDPQLERHTERPLVERVMARAAGETPARPPVQRRVGLGRSWSQTAVLAMVALIAIATGIVQVERESSDASLSEMVQMGTGEAPLEVAGL